MVARRPAGTGRSREWVVWSVAALLLTVIIAELAFGSSAGSVQRLLMVPTAAAFVVSAAVLVAHRPDNPVSWLLVLPPVYLAADGLGDLAVTLLDGRAELWVRWAEQSLFAPTMFPLAALMPVLFPTGSPPSPRWRWVVVAGAVGVAGLSLGNALAPDLLSEVDGGVANPAAIVPEGVAMAILGGGLVAFVLAFVGGAVSLVVRTRRATGVERQQIRWVGRAAIGAFLGWATAGILESRGVDFNGHIFVAGLALLPLAVAVAVLRFRLYDLDRLVSRTLTWAAVSGVLAAVYVTSVVGAQQLVGGREVPDVVVAGSTLLAAALVRPVHARLQGLIDRRFNRSHQGADVAVSDFGRRLRDEVDLDSVERDLRGVVATSLAPRAVSVWRPRSLPGE